VPGESGRALLLGVWQQEFVVLGLAGSELGVCNPNYGISSISITVDQVTGALPVTSGEGKWVVELSSGCQTKANTVHLDIERPLPRGSLRAGLLKPCRVVRCHLSVSRAGSACAQDRYGKLGAVWQAVVCKILDFKTCFGPNHVL